MNETPLFTDRADAGRRLAGHLGAYAARDDVVVLALPRGGVPVGFHVARALGAPLDVLVVRKLGVPGYRELAMGAIAAGVRVLEHETVRAHAIPPWVIEREAAREHAELLRREAMYRGGLPPLDVRGKTVIVVDDGIATGASARAAAAALRALNPARIVVAAPVAAPGSMAPVAAVADEVVCLATPPGFRAVAPFYRAFPQTTDDEVRALLHAARARTPAPVAAHAL
ncbi:MAG TPA: phosphoribosyltransferase family protein [Longimicrobium sp.]|nr:phosphoribosyltransferase family protein [Longimicrobium sp.]